MLTDVQIAGFTARVHWYWDYFCNRGSYQLAFQEGCGPLQPSNASNATAAVDCGFPCYEGTAFIGELDVESTKSYSFFLSAQCTLDYYSYYYYYYYDGDESVIETNYSAPLCIHGNSSRIGTLYLAFGASSVSAAFVPPFLDCYTNTLYNVFIYQDPYCNLDTATNRTPVVVHTTNELGFFIPDLQPDTWYWFDVRGYCNGTWITSEPICNKTYSEPLEVIGVTTTTTTATVYWNTYEGMLHECWSVAQYTVSFFTEFNSIVSLTASFQNLSSVTVPANSTMATIKDLEENTEYFGFLTAFCNYPSATVLADQLLRVSTFEPPIQIVSVIPDVYDVYITWTVPPCTDPTYEVLARVGCFSEGGAEDLTRRTNKNYTTIDSLSPYTYYDLSVTAHCNATYQLQSQRTCARTRSAPPTITSWTATASTMAFMWNTSTCNSFLYEINITSGCETTQDSNVEVYSVFNMTAAEPEPPQQPRQNASSSNTNSSLYSYSIFGLKPGTDYGIKIRAFCVRGSEITEYSDVVCAMTAEPDIECNSSVAFFTLSQNSDSQPVSNQLVAAIYDPISNGNTYFGVDLQDQLFLLKVNVLGSRGLLPFGTEYGGSEYEFSYSYSSYYGLQYTLPRPLPFFGKDHSILYVNARGFISIGEPYLNPWSITPFPLTGDVPMVAAFWWWYYTKVYVHSYQQGSSAFHDAVINVVGDRLRQFDRVNSTFQPETLVSITWSLVS